MGQALLAVRTAPRRERCERHDGVVLHLEESLRCMGCEIIHELYENGMYESVREMNLSSLPGGNHSACRTPVEQIVFDPRLECIVRLQESLKSGNLFELDTRALRR